MQNYRKEYPRPQFRRDGWTCLNGEWEFEFDDDDTGVKRGIYAGQTALNDKITVPFSYQWEASGVSDATQHDVVWYRRKFTPENGKKRALLCFNASDYKTDVWINGRHALRHEGGFTPFKADITGLLKKGENVITVRCEDTLDSAQPRGKQSWTGEPFTCFYIPNSGIWGSVWLEYFGEDCIDDYLLQTDIDNLELKGYVETLYGKADALEITLTFNDKKIKRQFFTLDGKMTEYAVKLTDTGFGFGELLWSPEKPNLVYVDFKLFKGGKLCDEAHARTGFRKISIDGQGNICLNDRKIYQRLILDQGYWNESGLTPPSVEALKKDIELSMAMGFNGARKHQKFEDPYFYYYAEELGFLTWCEMPSAYTYCGREINKITNEWLGIVNAAKNFTSVIAYVPLNESWGVREIKTNKSQQDFAKSLYYLTKAADGTRLISTNDGFENVDDTDIVSVHDYDIKSEEEFAVKYNGNYNGLYPQGWALFADGHGYKGQPVLLTEFGGIAYVSEQRGAAWGYGNGAKDGKELCARLEQLLKGIANTEFQGYCYTQLTDVQQEVNGLLYSDRTPKTDVAALKKIFENK